MMKDGAFMKSQPTDFKEAICCWTKHPSPNSQYRNGCRACQRHYYHLQRCLRTLRATTLRLLNRMGAKISGIASNLLTIEGVEELHGAQHTVLPDMIEVGSFIGMAAMTKSEITIKNVSYENLGIIPESFRRLGIKLEQRGDDIYVPAQETYQIESFIDGSIMTIADATWPGLTPDLLSVMLVVATQAKGSVLIHQKMFESRLFFVDKLIDMGAQIILCDPHRAVVIGHNHGFKLRGARLTSRIYVRYRPSDCRHECRRNQYH